MYNVSIQLMLPALINVLHFLSFRKDMSTDIIADQTSFYSLLNLTALGVVCAWAFYVWTFQQFHGGHIVEAEYHTLLKTEVKKHKQERWQAANPTL